MTINTEAAELLHAVADLYECGALKWVPPAMTRFELLQASVGNALAELCAETLATCKAKYAAANEIERLTSGDLIAWQKNLRRNTRHVINLLRRAAVRLERA